jgi:hypothetical protein
VSTYKKIRCKAQCGLSCQWTIGEKAGRWRLVGLGNVKNGRNPVPTDFVPFELSNAVLGHHKPDFATFEEAAQHARSL